MYENIGLEKKSASCKELSIDGIVGSFNMSKASAYRLAKRRGWNKESRPLDKGGRKIIYLVPDADLPESFEVDDEKRLPEPVELETGKHVVSELPSPAVCESYNDVPDLVPATTIPEHELHRAQLKAEICNRILSLTAETGIRKSAIDDVLEAYNSGFFVADLFKLEGKRSSRTFRNWLQAYEESGRDFKSLVRIPRTSNQMKTTVQEQNFLLNLLLDANRIKIGSAIRKLKQLERVGILKSPTSERSLRRWCENWRDAHVQQWSLLRKGAKFAKDNMLLTILRDSCLKVGDVWVADGHKLAFDIIDPKTGRPKRMTRTACSGKIHLGSTCKHDKTKGNIRKLVKKAIINLTIIMAWMISNSKIKVEERFYFKNAKVAIHKSVPNINK